MMKKTTTVRTVSVVLAAVMAGTLAGCGVTIGGDSGSSTDTKKTVSASTDESSTAPTIATPGGSATEPSAGGQYEGDVKSLLTPPGATVVASSSGELVLMSTDSVDSLASFYEDALDQLGARRSEAADVGSAWAYDGTYSNGQVIQVSVVEAGGTRSIAITY